MQKKLFQILLIAAMLCPNVVLAATAGGVSKKDQTTTGTKALAYIENCPNTWTWCEVQGFGCKICPGTPCNYNTAANCEYIGG